MTNFASEVKNPNPTAQTAEASKSISSPTKQSNLSGFHSLFRNQKQEFATPIANPSQTNDSNGLRIDGSFGCNLK